MQYFYEILNFLKIIKYVIKIFVLRLIKFNYLAINSKDFKL